MVRYIIKMLKAVHRLLSHYSQVTKLFQGINGPTYSQNSGQIKSKFSILIDYFYLFFILKILPTNYYLFQFDCKDRKQFKEYMDKPIAPILRHKLYNSIWDDDYSCLVNDKYVFHCFCQYHNLPVPELYGVWRDGFHGGSERNLMDLISRRNVERAILKPLRGMQGKGIHFISREKAATLLGNSSPELHRSLPEEMTKQGFILQEFVKQHPELDRVNPHSVNTIRIVTFLTRDEEVAFLSAILRTSSSHSPIDNFSSGGIVVGIDLETGRLKKLGFQSPAFGRTSAEHPLTRLSFHNFRIPFWEELKRTAVRAQRIFHHQKSIGWDFGISGDGPLLIEGNIEWGTAGIQAANGGILTQKNRKLFLQYGLSL